MDTDYTNNVITTMQHHLDAANKYLTELSKGYRSSEKQNTLLDAAMHQVELCCIDMRNLCEKVRPTIPPSPIRSYNHKEIFGEVTQLDNGWLDIRLNARSKGIRKAGGKGQQKTTDPYHWNKSTVRKILARQEYCGDVINFKTYSVSYKNKKRHANNPEDILVFKDVHEPIIDRTTFETIQLKRGNTRKRKTFDGEKNMFSGLLVCPECGSNLNYHFNQKNPSIKYLNCAGHNQGKRKICSTTHYIRVDFLEQVVLGEIRRLTRFACHHEELFTKAVSDYSKQALDFQLEARQSELKTLMARDKELDRLFERLYEDNVAGKISDDRFKKMSMKYEDEQKEITERMTSIRNLLDDLSGKAITTDKFIAAVKKYTRVKKLTARMLNELIDHIEVYHAEIIDGVKTQKITIYYNCIGSIEIPEDLPIAAPEVTLQTRKGVTVSYQPNTLVTAV